MPHAARPGAAQFVPAHVAAFDELQEGDELLFGEVAAAAFIGKRRERLDEVDVAGVGAVGAFHAPDGDDVGRADAALAFQLLQQAAVLREFGASLARPFWMRSAETAPSRYAQIILFCSGCLRSAETTFSS